MTAKRHDDGLSAIDYGLVWLNRFAWLTACMTLLLLIAGGLVTSTDSGLSVPDWPLSYGQFFPPMVGGILYEHSHRLIAAVVALLIAILAGWLWLKEPRRGVRMLGYAALGAVVAQAILGGLTVLLALPPTISVAHACLGQVVFGLVVSLALATSPMWQARRRDADDPRLRVLCISTTSLIMLQLFLGAVIRHTGMAMTPHLIGAGLVSVMVGAVGWRIGRIRRRAPGVFRLAMALAVGLVGQLALGGLAAVHRDHALLTTAHQALGALILAGACVLTASVWRAGETALAVGVRPVAQDLPA